MDGLGEGGGLNVAIADGFWARLSIDVIESIAVELGLGRIWGDACAAIDGRGSRVVGGLLLSGGLGGRLGPRSLSLDGGFSATIW